MDRVGARLGRPLGLASLAAAGGRPQAIVVLSGYVGQTGTPGPVPAPDGHPLVMIVKK